MRILCLANICADGSTASADLIGDNRFSFSLSDFTRLIICTAKSMDCVLNLLSDIFTPPAAQTLYYKRFSFSIFREVWLRQVKQRRCRCEVLRCAQCEVKCSASYRAEVTLRARSALHLRSILHVPWKRNTSLKRTHICRRQMWAFSWRAQQDLNLRPTGS